MKTKLALLLITPALLFTACNKEQEEDEPKVISSSEAKAFIEENYNIHTDDQDNCVVANKVSATWNFNFTGFDKSPFDTFPLEIVQRFFMKLTGFPVGEEPCFADYITQLSSSDPKQEKIIDKSGKSHVLDSTDPDAMDFITGLYSDFDNAKFSLLGKELTISGSAIVASKIDIGGGKAINLKVDVDTMTITFNEKGIVKEAHATAKKQNIISEYTDKMMSGQLDITFANFVIPNFN